MILWLLNVTLIFYLSCFVYFMFSVIYFFALLLICEDLGEKTGPSSQFEKHCFRGHDLRELGKENRILSIYLTRTLGRECLSLLISGRKKERKREREGERDG